ncbi:MAG: heterodisulfide reductase, subunit B [Candidatus Neomarinimicrobiota bacterium]|nr:MAG: heterodisulfide reductase, subunit B [Candidatus Neomarinimicrobiota bacterium]
MLKIPYFPGCTLKSNAQHFEDSAIAAARELGIEFVELPRWNCCGVVSSLTTDDIMHHVAPVRNFVRVLEMNSEGLVQNEKRLITLCSMCFNTLSRSNKRVKNNTDDLDAINEFMSNEIDYDGSVNVIHFLSLLKEIGFDKVRDRVKKPLNNLKIAGYYGCMLLRPTDIGIDHSETPSILENFIESLGATAIDWHSKSKCCGSYLTLSNKNTALNLSHDILTDAQRNGADLIITSCPLCAFNLDNRQKDIKQKFPDFESIPVFYFTELMTVAFGLEKRLGDFSV